MQPTTRKHEIINPGSTIRYTDEVPLSFNTVVMERLGNVRVSRSMVTEVRKGRRKNAAVMEVITNTLINWDSIQQERIKRFTL